MNKLSLFVCLSIVSTVAFAEDIWVRAKDYIYSDATKAAAADSQVNVSLCNDACRDEGIAKNTALSAARDPGGSGIIYENRKVTGGTTIGFCKCVPPGKGKK